MRTVKSTPFATITEYSRRTNKTQGNADAETVTGRKGENCGIREGRGGINSEQVKKVQGEGREGMKETETRGNVSVCLDLHILK